mgnify:CR=1 FL=1
MLSELFFRQPLTGSYAALLGAAAVAAYYQMATGSLLNALGLQRWNVATAISAELCQLACWLPPGCWQGQRHTGPFTATAGHVF